MKCAFPKCDNKDVSNHHITYVSKESGLESLKSPLCKEHHNKITALNCFMARNNDNFISTLTNRQRVEIFNKFINGDYLVFTFLEARAQEWYGGSEPDEDQARKSAYVISKDRYEGKLFASGYSNGLKWECCPTCGKKID